MKTDRERIALGECISDRGVDHCPVCVDMCEAFHWKVALSETLKENFISPPNPTTEQDNKQ